MDVLSLSLRQIVDLVGGKHLSCREVAQAYLSAIASRDADIHSYLWVNERVLDEARGRDERLAAGEPPGPLEGVPVAVKDNICVRGLPATCASRILEGFSPPYDATAVARLKEAGALILGKTNMDEFAFGSSTESSAYGITRNPVDLSRVPGGSSGGSAAAVAARLCAAALGTDTGGSIRQPAAFCGVVGMKPTYGRVSRYGLIAFASSLDQIGPLSRTVEDACRMLSVIAGGDRRDATSIHEPVPDYTSFLRQDLRGLKLGVPRECFVDEMDPEVDRSVRAAAAAAKDAGAEVREISLPHTPLGLAVYYVVATAEASTNLARFDGIRYGMRVPADDLDRLYAETRGKGFGAEVKRRIILGTFVLSSGYYDAYYLKAQKVRTLIVRDFNAAFQQVDAVLMPTAPEQAFRAGEKTREPLRMYLSDLFTVNANLAGLPAISIPAGISADGLPLGVQIVGPRLREDVVFGAASGLERALSASQR